MRYAIGAAWVLACLLLAMGFSHMGLQVVGPAAATEMQTASLGGGSPAARAAPQQNMSTLPKTAQMRCPAGQLLFLSSACGCNGACCAACPQGARYLNHCTCRCEAAAPAAAACRFGFSVGSQ